jgi:hypothetical protein
MPMKITNTLPQFENTNALLLVSGTQRAEAYRAGDGVIDKIVEFRASLPEHSDRPDMKVRSVGGQTLGMSSTHENVQEDMEREFIADFKRQTEALTKEEWHEVYLFAPAHALKILAGALPAKLHDKLVGKITGNYTKATPFELLEKISNAA